MKKITALMLSSVLILSLVLMFSLNACNSDNSNNLSDDNDELIVGSFSYADVCEIFREGEPGVKTDGFNNITEQKIETPQDAVEIAKNEIYDSYNAVQVDFDETEKIWNVLFYTESEEENVAIAGGGANVYLTENGITIRIVFGE